MKLVVWTVGAERNVVGTHFCSDDMLQEFKSIWIYVTSFEDEILSLRILSVEDTVEFVAKACHCDMSPWFDASCVQTLTLSRRHETSIILL